MSEEELYHRLGQIESKLKEMNGNKIPIKTVVPLVIFLLVQSSAGIWWASMIDAQVQQNRHLITEKTQDRFYRSEALEMFKNVHTRIDNRGVQIEDLKNQLIRIENKLDVLVGVRNKN